MSSTTTTKKRKSDASSGSTSKKTRISNDDHDDAKALVSNILADTKNYRVSYEDDDVKNNLVSLALYARSLEQSTGTKSTKTKEDLEAAAQKLAYACQRGITKQMQWKPSCKTGSARWIYDGVCADPDVFGILLGLDGQPKFKTKKFPKDEFQELIGELKASVRYDVLRLTSDVNVQWKLDEGTFKFSGSYGKQTQSISN